MRGFIQPSPGVASSAVYAFVRAICVTLRWQVIGAERIDDLIAQNDKGVICVLWHGRTFLPTNYFRGRGYWSMISTSRDGEYQDRIFKRFGFNTVRGSSSARGAVQATLTLVKQVKAGSVLAVTPDGPRGPSRCAQPGVIYLAMKSGCPILPVGISASPRRLMRTWDRYLIPMPFARAVVVFGQPIYIPSDVRSEVEQQLWAQKVGAEIDTLEMEAERLAGAPLPQNAT
ncbi:MAG: lysophospholipid acyltransferase family protein [Capsulimonadaceae bacterium]